MASGVLILSELCDLPLILELIESAEYQAMLGRKPVSTEAIEKVALQVEYDKTSNLQASTSVRRVEEALNLPHSTVQKIMRNIPIYYPYKLQLVQELLPHDLETQNLFSTILDRVLGARAAGVHYRLCSVWTLVPVGKNEKKAGRGEREKKRKRDRKRRELVVLGSGKENPRVLIRDADHESKTRMRNNALRTGPRQAVE
ncbi:uncharacterized protein TNCV_20521 [Trichonephila clavipes]|uniref:Uncharacterized protein n=1 Tax=Trichonephila clavipes TaxID=2585209 RepID=A0A8X6R679_TRICX|nr:uncharacterized protein TNCV_20521 [Trichonephila clavipes]